MRCDVTVTLARVTVQGRVCRRQGVMMGFVSLLLPSL
jgi:hypothetical protein